MNVRVLERLHFPEEGERGIESEGERVVDWKARKWK